MNHFAVDQPRIVPYVTMFDKPRGFLRRLYAGISDEDPYGRILDSLARFLCLHIMHTIFNPSI